MHAAFDALAFDLDGTLYPDSRLYIRLIPFLLKHHRLLFALGKARDRIRKLDRAGEWVPEPGFYAAQARIVAEILGEDAPGVEAQIESLIYRGWEPFFTRISLRAGVREALAAFRGAGLKLAVLSDFPPEQKLAHLGLAGYLDVILGSEPTGRLKPHPASFLELARRLDTAPERILYVGNSIACDIEGAKNAGMGAALLAPFYRARRGRERGADFVFSTYRQLSEYVLHWGK
ncbi:MAG: HAD family hydrolase [Treponema sp.]|jgi:putative hydrolase of the HAD superfamily|nr:HAD family hydrolase [Treponema sp.]